MMPAFIICTSSPIPGVRMRQTVSAIFTMSTSDWPTPTVSMMTASKPQASSMSAASCVPRLTPPRFPREPMLRMKTPSSTAWSCMRRRSPRIAPPVKGLDGSIAITPTFLPSALNCEMSLLTKVLLPAPGLPVIPMTWALPVLGYIFFIISLDSGDSASTRLIRRPMDLGSPSKARVSSLSMVSNAPCFYFVR